MELYYFILIDQNALGPVEIARRRGRQIINWNNIILLTRCTADRFLPITFHRHQVCDKVYILPRGLRPSCKKCNLVLPRSN